MSDELPETYPATAGIDELHPLTRITVAVFGLGVDTIEFAPEQTTLRIKRSEPYRDDRDLLAVDTEMVALELRGESAMLGPISLRGGSELIPDPERAIHGRIVQATKDGAFPADNWFDVFLEVETRMGTFVNRKGGAHAGAHRSYTAGLRCDALSIAYRNQSLSEGSRCRGRAGRGHHHCGAP